MPSFIHDIFGGHPFFALCVAIFAIGILLFLTAKLVSSYPIIVLAVVFVLGASVAAFRDGRGMLGAYWIAFSAAAVIASALHFYKNIRGAFWWSLGAVAAMIVSALPLKGGAYESTEDANPISLVAILIPVIVFIAIGLVGSLLFPRLIHKDKDQRKHRTNTDNLIGKRVRITRELENEHILRGFIGDVDWQIEAYLPNESFKVGDLVVIHHIKGVTLICTRDGKDLREEQKETRRVQAEKARIERMKKRAEREAEKAAHRLKVEKQKAQREEERAKEEAELRKIREERAIQKAKEDEELKQVRDSRLASARARKEELAKEREAAKEKAREERAAKAAKKHPEAAERAKLAEKVLKERRAEKVVKEKPAKVSKSRIEREKERSEREAEKAAYRLEIEKLKIQREEDKAKAVAELRLAKLERAQARHVEEPKKAEKVVKEKPAKVKKVSSRSKREMIYICLSSAIVLACIVIVVLCFIQGIKDSDILNVLIFVFFGLAIAYLVAIFILEALNEKKKEKPSKEEPKEEIKEEIKVEEPVVEEQAPVKKEKAEFVPFSIRMKEADPFVREAYNELKSEVLSYGIKSRVSSTSDRFRLHKKEYVKMVIAGQFLKLYFALNPEDYVNTTYPFDDAGRMGAHKDTPFVFKIKSGLSVRRAKQLINDVASKDGLAQGEVEAHDWAAELENLVAESDEDEE